MSAGKRGRAERKARQALAWAMAVGMVVVLAVGACAREAGTTSPRSIPGTGSATPSPPVTSSPPSPSVGPGYPNLSRFTDPFDRFAYKSAYSECRVIGVDGMAEAFGGDPNQPPSVARAYAVTTFPESVDHRQATFQGCLDAFDTGSQ